MALDTILIPEKIHITMPDGSIWSIPLGLVVEDKAKYYLRDFENLQSAVKEVYEDFIYDPRSAFDWASNQMNWSDVSTYAEIVVYAPLPDFQDGWVNGEKVLYRE